MFAVILCPMGGVSSKMGRAVSVLIVVRVFPNRLGTMQLSKRMVFPLPGAEVRCAC